MLEGGCSLPKARLRLEAAKPAYRCCSQFPEPCRRLAVGSKHNPLTGRPGSGGWPLCAASCLTRLGPCCTIHPQHGKLGVSANRSSLLRLFLPEPLVPMPFG